MFFARSYALLLSVVIPVFKSERSINILYNQIRETLEKEDLSFEIIPVCDASPDNVWEVLEKLAKSDKRLRPILFSSNAGQQQATLCGIDHASGDYILTLDDDLEFSPYDIPKMLRMLKEHQYDLVYGVAQKKEQKGIKRFSAKIAREIIGLFFPRLKYLESFRIFKKEVRTAVDTSKKFILDFEYSTNKINIGKCDVSHNKRMFGESNYSMFGSLYVWFTFLFKYTLIPHMALLFLLVIAYLFSINIWIVTILAAPLVFLYVKYRLQTSSPYQIEQKINL